MVRDFYREENHFENSLSLSGFVVNGVAIVATISNNIPLVIVALEGSVKGFAL